MTQGRHRSAAAVGAGPDPGGLLDLGERSPGEPPVRPADERPPRRVPSSPAHAVLDDAGAPDRGRVTDVVLDLLYGHRPLHLDTLYLSAVTALPVEDIDDAMDDLVRRRLVVARAVSGRVSYAAR